MRSVTQNGWLVFQRDTNRTCRAHGYLLRVYISYGYAL